MLPSRSRAPTPIDRQPILSGARNCYLSIQSLPFPFFPLFSFPFFFFPLFPFLFSFIRFLIHVTSHYLLEDSEYHNRIIIPEERCNFGTILRRFRYVKMAILRGPEGNQMLVRSRGSIGALLGNRRPSPRLLLMCPFEKGNLNRLAKRSLC